MQEDWKINGKAVKPMRNAMMACEAEIMTSVAERSTNLRLLFQRWRRRSPLWMRERKEEDEGEGFADLRASIFPQNTGKEKAIRPRCCFHQCTAFEGKDF
jgi:hypothetical protein